MPEMGGYVPKGYSSRWQPTTTVAANEGGEQAETAPGTLVDQAGILLDLLRDCEGMLNMMYLPEPGQAREQTNLYGLADLIHDSDEVAQRLFIHIKRITELIGRL